VQREGVRRAVVGIKIRVDLTALFTEMSEITEMTLPRMSSRTAMILTVTVSRISDAMARTHFYPVQLYSERERGKEKEKEKTAIIAAMVNQVLKTV
jgi:hypothetical protein